MDAAAFGAAPRVLLVLALLSASLVGGRLGAEAATRFVAPGGSDVAPCAPQSAACRTIGFALGLASGGDVIRVAAGTYTTPLEAFPLDIARSITLAGAGASATKIDGALTAGVIAIESGTTVSITGLTIQNGKIGSNGGGIGGPAGGPFSGPVSLTLNDVALRNNTASSATSGVTGGGLGLVVTGALTVSLTDVVVTGNTAETSADGQQVFGGGVSLSSDASIQFAATRLTVTGNTARATGTDPNGGALGGGVTLFSGGPINAALIDIVLTKNTAASSGGVSAGGGLLMLAPAGSQSFTNITASENVSINTATVRANTGFAGGLGLVTANATVTNSTISGNLAAGTENAIGGGLAIATTEQSGGPSTVTLVNVTISDNSAKSPSLNVGGIGTVGNATVRFRNTIVTNSLGANCGGQGTFTSLGHNLESANDCQFSASGDLHDTDPQLGPLADNGGFTQTQAVLAASPAVNAGTNTGCPPVDQRGVTRPQGTACDIGAFELALAAGVPLLDLPGLTVMALLMTAAALFAMRKRGSAQ